MNQKIYVTDDDGNEVALPMRWVVCPQCEGRGGTSAHLGAFTWDEMDDMGDEFREDYFSGRYDRSCNLCHGRTTVEEADWDLMTPEQERLYECFLDAKYQYDAVAAAERRAGC